LVSGGEGFCDEVASPDWLSGSHATGEWAGARPWLEKIGVEVSGSYTFDWSAPLSGGLSRHGAGRGLLDLGVAIDMDKLAGLPGGQFFAEFQDFHGRNGSTDVGDLQGFSNIDADPFGKAYELWYQQEVLDGKLRVKIGQVDANSEFAIPEAAGALLNSSSAGFSPTILGFPTYPDPRLSVNVFVRPLKSFYFAAGAYGSTIREAFDFGHPFWIGEAGFKWEHAGSLGAGRIAGGYWHDSATIDRFDGSTQDGTSGFYFVGEQRLWRPESTEENDPRGVAAYLQYGHGSAGVSTFTHHVGAGLQWVGPAASRPADILGLGGNWTKSSNDPVSGFTAGEWNLEANYVIEVVPFFHVVPDFQWIGNPGGDATRDAAFVATLRMIVDF
jgi:porin